MQSAATVQTCNTWPIVPFCCCPPPPPPRPNACTHALKPGTAMRCALCMTKASQWHGSNSSNAIAVRHWNTRCACHDSALHPRARHGTRKRTERKMVRFRGHKHNTTSSTTRADNATGVTNTNVAQRYARPGGSETPFCTCLGRYHPHPPERAHRQLRQHHDWVHMRTCNMSKGQGAETTSGHTNVQVRHVCAAKLHDKSTCVAPQRQPHAQHLLHPRTLPAFVC